MSGRSAIVAALVAALLFGASTPFAKILVGELSPVLLAALLYLGSGVGLWTVCLIRDRRVVVPHLSPHEWFWFLGAIAVGGVLGPVLLTAGLRQTPASNASLLLNFEAVFTSLIAWIIFRENAGRRLVLGMALIIGGGAVLTWPSEPGRAPLAGAILIGCACLCWAIDNNLTRKVSAVDALFIAGTKGLVAGSVNLGLAVALRASPPTALLAGSAMVIGLFGYGVSLALFVLALRGLGAARAGAYFSTAPFLGALIAIAALHESATAGFWLAALLMFAGVALHLTERHVHRHAHQVLDHSHPHSHDAHHQHEHGFSWDGVEPHSHVHHHQALTHEHAHFPDVHHRHEH